MKKIIASAFAIAMALGTAQYGYAGKVNVEDTIKAEAAINDVSLMTDWQQVRVHISKVYTIAKSLQEKLRSAVLETNMMKGGLIGKKTVKAMFGRMKNVDNYPDGFLELRTDAELVAKSLLDVLKKAYDSNEKNGIKAIDSLNASLDKKPAEKAKSLIADFTKLNDSAKALNSNISDFDAEYLDGLIKDLSKASKELNVVLHDSGYNPVAFFRVLEGNTETASAPVSGLTPEMNKRFLQLENAVKNLERRVTTLER